jgi:hypothetical protein
MKKRVDLREGGGIREKCKKKMMKAYERVGKED